LALYKKSGLLEEYKVNIVNVSDYGNVRLSLKTGPRIELGSGDYEDKMKILKEVLGDIKQKGKAARAVDLRSREARIIF
jgi:cell division septal protein FtsQ